MRRVSVVLLLLACLHVPARAAEDGVAPAERTAIRQVIAAQIEAFRHDDGASALRFATPEIRARFGDGAHFLAMVRTAYPAVFRPRSFEFGALSADASLVTQKVELVGPDGAPALALYDMEREPDGWRIAGCRLAKSERLEL